MKGQKTQGRERQINLGLSTKGIKMKNATIIGMMLLAMVNCAYSADITFTSSGTIQNGDVYEHVYLENDGIVVDMTGGQIGNLQISYTACD